MNEKIFLSVFEKHEQDVIDEFQVPCSLCGGTRKVITGRGTENEEIEPCPECSLSEEADFTGVTGDR